MPLDKDKKLLFIHIPKTGGTSIEHFFGMTHPENFRFARWDRDRHDFLKKYKHLTESDKIYYEPQHYPVSILKYLIEDYDQYFKFAFVRNPYTRMLSEYFWQKRHTLRFNFDFNPIDFHNWCLSFLTVIDSSHKEPQFEFIDNSIDFIGKYENFAHDFNRLLSVLSGKKNEYAVYRNRKLQILNTTGVSKDLLVGRFLSETREIIYKTYKDDFEKFGYDVLPSGENKPVDAVNRNQKLISVVVPVINCSEHIKQCVQSVFDSDFESDKMEIIIVDDSGNENILSIVDELKAGSKINIKLISNDTRLGLIRSRNRGVLNANGEFLFFLDADNYIGNNCIRKHYETIAQSTDIMACYAPIQVFYDSTGDFLTKTSNRPFDYEQLLQGNYIDAMAMFRKDDFIDSGMFDNVLPAYGWEDYELWLRLGKTNKKVAFIEGAPLSYCRRYHVGESDTYTADQYNLLVYYLKQKYPIKLRLRKSEILQNLVQSKSVLERIIRRLKKYI